MAERVLVTGHTGFLGTSLARALHEHGHTVVGCAASTGQDLTDPQWHQHLPAGEIDRVFHLAAATRIPKAWDNPAVFYSSNVRATQHVLDFCAAHSLPLVYASAYIYGQPQYLPLDEDHPVRPNNPYGHSKYIAEQMCIFHEQYAQLPVKIARIFNIYGPGQSTDFVIPHILGQLREQGQVCLHSDSRRDFIHVDDVVRALLCFMQDGGEHTIYNVGSGRSYSLRQVVDMAADILGIPSRVSVQGSPRQNDVADVVAHTGRMQNDFGWQCQIDMHAGLRSCLAEAQK